MNSGFLAFGLGLAAVQAAMANDAAPAFVTSETNGGWSNGGYYVHNNMWNASSGETLYARAYNDWYVTATYPNTTDVKAYPNVHKDINDLKGLPLGSYHVITSTFAARAPKAGIYDVAYDIWLNGVGSGKGVTEFMIWTQNHKQTPAGRRLDQVILDGVAYDAFRDTEGGSNLITLVPDKVLVAGSLNLKPMLDWATTKGWMPANPTLNQICYGVEICSTDNQPATFYFTNFSLTMQ